MSNNRNYFLGDMENVKISTNRNGAKMDNILNTAQKIGKQLRSSEHPDYIEIPDSYPIEHDYENDYSSRNTWGGSELDLNNKEKNLRKKTPEDLSSINFSEEIKIDFITSIDFRIMCRFLGISVIKDLKNHPYTQTPLITLLLMQSLIGFMKKKGYIFSGELNFDRNGNSIPTEKIVWKIKEKEVSFTTTGFLYFEKKNRKNKDKNVVFFLYADLDRFSSSIMCYTKEGKRSESFIKELEDYTKKIIA